METIRMRDGTVIENINVCYPNSMDGALVIEVTAVDVPRMLELTTLLNDPEKAGVIVSVDRLGAETAFAGYSAMRSAVYNGLINTLTVFMVKQGGA